MSEPVAAAATARGSGAWHEPWLGLDSYRERDHPRFFGRDREADQLLQFVQRDVLTVVFGASGTGKTSLLHAGLFPRLRSHHCLPIPIRLDYASGRTELTRQIKDSVVHTISMADVEVESRCPEPSTGEEETLWEYLHRVELWDTRNQPITPVLVFDQFEEVFTLGRDRPETAVFLRDFADLVESYVPASVRARLESLGGKAAFGYLTAFYKVVVSLREDYVARLDELRQSIPSIMHNRFVLKPMTGVQALEAVTGPGRGIVSDAVAMEIVRFVAASDDARDSARQALSDLRIEPALLSLVCHELNRRRIALEQEQITSQQVHEARSDILDDFYARSFEGLDPRARVFVEDRLLTGTGFRTVAPREDAVRMGLERAIGTLIDRRLVRSEERLGIPHLELTHDVLVPVVQRSRERRRQIEASKAQVAEQRAKRQKAYRLAAVCALLALVAAGLAVFTKRQQVRTDALRRLALSNYLYLKSQSQPEPVDLSLLLALEAVRVVPTSDAASRLAAAIDSSRALNAFLHGHKARVNAVAVSADGKVAASAGLDKTIIIWDVGTRTQRGERLVGHGDSVRSVAFSPNASLLASGGADGNVVIWDLAARKHESFSAHTGTVHQVAFSPDGKMLVSGGTDARVVLWDVATRQPLGPALEGHGDEVLSVAFARDGKRLASASHDGRIVLWDLTTRRTLASLDAVTLPSSIEFSADGEMLAVADDREIVLWSVAPGARPQRMRVLLGHADTVSSVAFSPDGRMLASASADRTIRVWNPATGGPVETPIGRHTGIVSSIAFGPRGLLLSGGVDEKVILWDLTRSQSVRRVVPGRQGQLWTVALSPDGQTMAWAGEAAAIVLTDLATLQQREVLTSSAVVSLDYSPDGKWLASADRRGSVLLLNPATLEQVTLGAVPGLRRVRFNPAGRSLASASDDGVIALWDGNRQQPTTKASHGGRLGAIAFSRDGRKLISAGAGGAVLVWDGNTLEQIRRIEGPTREMLYAVAVSPAGDEVAIGAANGFAWVGNLAAERTEWRTLGKKMDLVRELAYHPDGRLLAASGRANTIAVWDAPAGRLLFSLAGHTRWIEGLAFSADGKVLASASDDGTVSLWNIDPQSWLAYACRMANRNLTTDEWREYLGEEPYRETCPGVSRRQSDGAR